MATIQKISPSLWFDKEAEAAANFYTSIFKDAKIGKTTRYGKVGKEIHGQEEGTVMTVEFWLAGQHFIALNGGPIFKFNESVSFVVHCQDQEEVDYYWEKLKVGGDEKSQVCGWLKDQFGLSWQIVPDVLGKLMTEGTAAQTGRVMASFLKMQKLDIQTLQGCFRW